MRKTIFTLIIFFLFSKILYAETIYSKYGEFSDYSDEYIEETDIIDVQKEKRYKIYKEINNIKEYATGYYSKVTNDYPLIDYNDYKIFYKYRKREKVVISDNLKIDSYDFDLNCLVLESTISDIKIEHNIEYSKNGIYTINFKFPFKTVKRKITVSIFENDYNLLETKIKELDEVYDNLLLNENLSNDQKEKVLKLKNYKDYTNYINEINNLKSQIIILNKQNENNNFEIQNLKNENNICTNNYKDNLNKISSLEKIIEDNKKIYESNILISNNKINSLIETNKLLNTKIINLNNNIDYLTETVSQNKEKYENELIKINLLLDEEKKNLFNKNKDLNICLEGQQKSKIFKNNYIKNVKVKNKISYVIIILLLFLCTLILNKKQKNL